MENKKLKPARYWEWRTCIVEMQHAETKLKVSEMQYEMMLKDHEIARLKAALFKTTLSSLKESKELAKKEYDKLKERIEKDLGISLNGCVIDDITFEIKKLEE